MDKLVCRNDEKNLRKIMAERRQLNQLKKSTTEKINSPLIKYDSKGNLSCIICRSNVKSLALWKVHVNSKQHKINIEEAKKLKEDIIIATKNSTKQSTKGKATEIINTSHTPSENVELSGPENGKHTAASKGILPELFFDEPSHKTKSVKDSLDEEWELFQREIKEATVISNTLITQDQSETYVDRQIIEIDEQIHNWSKVLILEEKLKHIHCANKANRQQQTVDESIATENNDLETFEELLDWRCKSLK